MVAIVQKEKIDLELALEAESERIINQLTREKQLIQKQASDLRDQLKKVLHIIHTYIVPLSLTLHSTPGCITSAHTSLALQPRR